MTVKGHTSSGLGGGDRQRPVPTGATSPQVVRLGSGRAFSDHGATRLGSPQTLSLPRALPAERLPRVHLHPLRAGVAEVLLGRPQFRTSANLHYGIIFDNHGRADLVESRSGLRHQGAFRTGTSCCGSIRLFSKRWEIHRLDGSLVRILPAVGHVADTHDLQVLGDGRPPGRRLRHARATSTRAPTAARATPRSSTPSYSR